jgi:CheY-like chemotaxis protein
METKPILVADDSEDDVVTLLRSFQQVGIQNPIISVQDGKEFINYLTGTGMYADRSQFPMPGIIFLDVKMPEVDGFQALDWMRKNREFDNIPVVMLTGTMPLVEATRAYQKGAISFLSKPCSPEHVKLLPDAAIKTLKFASLILVSMGRSIFR